MCCWGIFVTVDFLVATLIVIEAFFQVTGKERIQARIHEHIQERIHERIHDSMQERIQ